MDIRIKLLNDLAKIPTRGSEHSAGYDIYAATKEDIHIPPHSTVKISTGIASSFPVNWFAAIFPRSGIATKRGLRLANCVAVIDADYRGEWLIPIHNDSDTIRTIQSGERIAQVILLPCVSLDFQVTNKLDETDRGSGGFGSSGEK